jgi:hypothetical protein
LCQRSIGQTSGHTAMVATRLEAALCFSGTQPTTSRPRWQVTVIGDFSEAPNAMAPRNSLPATALASRYEAPLASSTAEGMTALRHRRPNLARRWEQSVAKHRMGTSKIPSVIGSRLPTCLDVAMIARHPCCRSVCVTTRLGGRLPIRADVDVHPGLRSGAFSTLSRQTGGGLWGWMGSVASHCAGFSIRSAPLVVIHLSA